MRVRVIPRLFLVLIYCRRAAKSAARQSPKWLKRIYANVNLLFYCSCRLMTGSKNSAKCEPFRESDGPVVSHISHRRQRKMSLVSIKGFFKRDNLSGQGSRTKFKTVLSGIHVRLACLFGPPIKLIDRSIDLLIDLLLFRA